MHSPLHSVPQRAATGGMPVAPDAMAIQNAKIKRLVWSLLPVSMRTDPSKGDVFDGIAGRRKQTIKDTLEASRRLQAERLDAQVWEQLELEAAREATDSGAPTTDTHPSTTGSGVGGTGRDGVRPGHHKRQVMELQRKSRLFRERCAAAAVGGGGTTSAVQQHDATDSNATTTAHGANPPSAVEGTLLPTLTIERPIDATMPHGSSDVGSPPCPSPFLLSSPVTQQAVGGSKMNAGGASSFLNTHHATVSGLTPRGEARITQAGRSYSPLAMDYMSRRGYDEAREYEDKLANEIIGSAGGAGGGGFLAPASKIVGGDAILQQRAAKSIPAQLEKELRRHTIEARVAERNDADGLLSSLRDGDDSATTTSNRRGGQSTEVGVAQVLVATTPTTNASPTSTPSPSQRHGLDDSETTGRAHMRGAGAAAVAVDQKRREEAAQLHQREQDNRTAANILAARAPFISIADHRGNDTGTANSRFITTGNHGLVGGGSSPMRRPPAGASTTRSANPRGALAVDARRPSGEAYHDDAHDEKSRRMLLVPTAHNGTVTKDVHRSCGMQPCVVVGSPQPLTAHAAIDWTASGPLGGPSAVAGLARSRRRRSTIPVIDLAKDALNQYDKKERAKATRLVCLPFGLPSSGEVNNNSNSTLLSCSAIAGTATNDVSATIAVGVDGGGGGSPLGATIPSDDDGPTMTAVSATGHHLPSAGSASRGMARQKPRHDHNRSVRPGTAPLPSAVAPPPAAIETATALQWPPKPSALSVVDQFGQPVCLETFVPPTELSARTCILDATPQVAARDRVAVALQRLSPEPLPMPPSLTTMSPMRCRPGSAALSEQSSFAAGGRPGSGATTNLARRAEALGGSAMVRRWMQYQTLKPEDRVNASLPVVVSRPATAQQPVATSLQDGKHSTSHRAASASLQLRKSSDAAARRKAIQVMFCRPKPQPSPNGAGGGPVCQQRW